MTEPVVIGVLLILVPIAFNVAFAELARTFDYPDILRREPAEILSRFSAGGAPLLWRWWAFAAVAVAFVPFGAAVPAVLAPGSTIAIVTVALAIAAGVVQAIGLVRWPFLVPELARRHADLATSPVGREAVEVVFASVHRLLGVGIGEHLGYLLTGLWSLALAGSIAVTGADVVPTWLAIPGAIVGIALVVGSFEFVGPNEAEGWALAGRLVPIAYIGWSAWLVVLGILAIL